MRGRGRVIYSFFSATLPALSFSLFLTLRCFVYLRNVPCTHLRSILSRYPCFSSLSLSLSLFLSVSLSLFHLIPHMSFLRRVRPYARTCASKRSNAPASQHGPAPSSCIAVSLDLHDPHESPRDSLPTSELSRRTRKAKRSNDIRTAHGCTSRYFMSI